VCNMKKKGLEKMKPVNILIDVKKRKISVRHGKNLFSAYRFDTRLQEKGREVYRERRNKCFNQGKVQRDWVEENYI